MEWFKTYANTAQRPSIQMLSHAAFRLWHDGRCYIAASETDGFIPATQLPRFGTHGTKRNASALIEALLWQAAPTGYVDVSWSAENQRTSDQAARDRMATAGRQARWRNAVSNGVTNGVSHGVSNAARGREEKRREEVEVSRSTHLRSVTA